MLNRECASGGARSDILAHTKVDDLSRGTFESIELSLVPAADQIVSEKNNSSFGERTSGQYLGSAVKQQ